MAGLDYVQHVFAMAVSGGVIFLIAAGLDTLLDSRARSRIEKSLASLDRIESGDLLINGAEGIVCFDDTSLSVLGRVPGPWVGKIKAARSRIENDMTRFDLQSARLDATALKRYGATLSPLAGCLFLMNPESGHSVAISYRKQRRMPGIRTADRIRRRLRLKGFEPDSEQTSLLQNRLELANQEKNLTRLHFLRVAHDMRMPLATLGLLRQRLHDAAQASGSTEVQEISARMGRQAEELRLYLDSLLSIESPGGTETAETLSPSGVLQALVEARMPAFEKKRVRLICRIEPLPELRLPHTSFVRILDNLLANALHFSPPGSAVRTGTTANGIWIEDSGPGLSPDDFEEYVELGRRNLGRSGGGHGLGLAAAFEMALSMGARLRLEKAEGRGARFLLVLPATS